MSEAVPFPVTSRDLEELAGQLVAADIPFAHGGRDPAVGLDCWGLLRLVYAARYGVELPDYAVDSTAPRRVEAASVVAAAVREWRPIAPGRERQGDGVLLLDEHGRPIHVAVVLGARRMLHASEATGIAVQRYDGVAWRHRVFGFFRRPELAGMTPAGAELA